jgi:hypothetical protein
VGWAETRARDALWLDGLDQSRWLEAVQQCLRTAARIAEDLEVHRKSILLTGIGLKRSEQACLCRCLCMSVCMHVCVCAFVCLCVCISLSLSLSLSVCMCVCID